MIRSTGLCTFCAHVQNAPDGVDGMACAAYPQGIPDQILYGGLDHRQPLADDNGITFEPDTESFTPVQIQAHIDRYEERYVTNQ